MSMNGPPGTISFLPLTGLPEVSPGNDLFNLIAQAIEVPGNPEPRPHDLLVVSQKIVSKAENRYVNLASVEPGDEALELARRCAKDPRLIELVLRESSEVLRAAPGVLIVRHRLGFVVANAGIDHSNLPAGGEKVLLLPADPDASAEQLRLQLEQRFGTPLAVLIADSFGRAWRLGVCGVCIGCAGLVPLVDQRSIPDRHGRLLEVTQIAVADQFCAAANLTTGEAAEGRPVVIARGVPAGWFESGHAADELLRPLEQDLFR